MRPRLFVNICPQGRVAVRGTCAARPRGATGKEQTDRRFGVGAYGVSPGGGLDERELRSGGVGGVSLGYAVKVTTVEHGVRRIPVHSDDALESHDLGALDQRIPRDSFALEATAVVRRADTPRRVKYLRHGRETDVEVIIPPLDTWSSK